MKIAMLTQWSGPDFQRMAKLVNPAKQTYCGRFGYDFIAINQRLDPQRHPVWDKILAIRRVLSNYDWVFWVDVDTVLWNPDVSLRRFLVDCPAHFIVQENHQGLNAGVFFVRNHPWSLEFLEAVYARRDLENHPWREQQAMIECLREDRFKTHAKVYPPRQPHGGFHGYFFLRDWDKLLIHFPGMDNRRRLPLMENLVLLAACPPHLRLMERTELGHFLNKLDLLGEGVEVGVECGEFSRTILDRWEGTTLHLVDVWRHRGGHAVASNTTDRQHEQKLEQTKERLQPHAGRYRIHRAMSTAAADEFAPGSLDFVYIDGDHRYESVLADLRAWFSKIRPGGLLAGHDFLDGERSQGNFGVRRAVCQFATEHGLHIAVTAEEHWPTWYTIA